MASRPPVAAIVEPFEAEASAQLLDAPLEILALVEAEAVPGAALEPLLDAIGIAGEARGLAAREHAAVEAEADLLADLAQLALDAAAAILAITLAVMLAIALAAIL